MIDFQILESTQEEHADCGPLREALERAEELCTQVNEGVREKENCDRLEWIQSHVQCEGVTEVDTHTVYPHTQYLSHMSVTLPLSPVQNLVFNSLTNCLGPRKLLHSGKVYKIKSNKELWAFLFNDFLLLTHAAKQFSSSGPDKLFSTKNNTQLKMYKPVRNKRHGRVRTRRHLFQMAHFDKVSKGHFLFEKCLLIAARSN